MRVFPYFSIVLLLVFPIFTFGQYAEEKSISIVASTSETPPSITLQWSDDLSATKWEVFKKNEKNEWAFVVNIASPDTYFVDTKIEIGKTYEYLVYKSTVSKRLGYGNIMTGIKVDPIHYHGSLLLLVDSSLVRQLPAEINQFETDINADGWMVSRLDVSELLDPVDIKDIIKNSYGKIQDLKSVVLLGNIAVPYSGNQAPDGHTPDHVGAWATDLYYADVNGNWTDTWVNNATATRVENQNIPSDGKFDQSVIPSDVELMVGRIDLEDLSLWKNTRIDRYRNYLNRNHLHRIGIYKTENKALVDNRFSTLEEGFAGQGYRYFPAMVGIKNTVNLPYTKTLKKAKYLIAYGCGPGDYTSCGRNSTFVVGSSDYSKDSIHTLFTILFGSYFGDFDNDNNMLRAPLAGLSPALFNFWAGRPNWNLQSFAFGYPIGYSVIQSQNGNLGIDANVNDLALTARGVQTSFMGDPTIKLRTNKMPSSPTAITIENKTKASIEWTAPKDSPNGYFVYRKDSKTGFWKVVSVMENANTFIDSFPENGTNEYMVKACKLIESPSGSYYSLSEGVYTSVDSISVIHTRMNQIERVDFQLYPNPANDQITFLCQSNSNDYNYISIVDILGKIHIKTGFWGQSKTIDITDLESGVYIIKAWNNEGSSTQKQFIKN